MKINWFRNYTLDEINEKNKNTLVDYLGIKITDLNESYLEGIMPVSDKVKQPFGIVHGGANCVLAETVGSLGANLILDQEKEHAVGLSINTNHIKAVRNGEVIGRAYLMHQGKKTHIWEIKTFNSKEELTSITTLTMSIISKLGLKA